MMPVFQRSEPLLRSSFSGPHDLVSGKAYGSPATSTSRARSTESVSGSCSCTRRPRPDCDCEAEAAARHCLNHVLHHIQPDTSAGDFSDSFLQGEAGQEEELEQFSLVKLLVTRGGCEVPSQDGFRTRSCSMPGPSSVTVTSSMPALWRASRRMVPWRGLPAVWRASWRFAAVIHRIAQQVRQWTFQPFQDIADPPVCSPR